MKLRISARLRDGLAALVELAAADVAVDPERWPENHPIHDAIEYLRART